MDAQMPVIQERDRYYAELRRHTLLGCRDLSELRSALHIANVCHWIQFGDEFTPTHPQEATRGPA